MSKIGKRNLYNKIVWGYQGGKLYRLKNIYLEHKIEIEEVIIFVQVDPPSIPNEVKEDVTVFKLEYGIGAQIFIKDKEGFDTIAKEYSGREHMLFRGFSANTHLSSRLFGKSLQMYEVGMINSFYQYANTYTSVNSLTNLLSNAQHYGLKTRLIDFSESYYVALYFAIGERKHSDGFEMLCFDYTDESVYSQIKESELKALIESRNRIKNLENNVRTFMKKNSHLEAYRMVDSDNPKDDKLYYIKPPFSNQRMMAQRGAFVVQTIDNNWENHILGRTMRITFSSELYEYAKRTVYNLGYNPYYMMPDLSGLCEAVNKEFQEDIE